jgi:hypothetical protein
MTDDQVTPPDLDDAPARLTDESLSALLAVLPKQGWRPMAARAAQARPVHAFEVPSGHIHLKLTLFGDDAEPRHRLEISAVHPEAPGIASRPAWAIHAEQPTEAVIRILARATITGPITVHIERTMPRRGWSQLKTYDHGARLLETRYADHRGRSVSLFPADPQTGEPAAWLIVRPGIDGHPAAIHATAATPQHLIAIAALIP